jgi:predicted dehydrogenase
VNADGFFVDFAQAVADPRVQALALVLPHDEHRRAAEIALSAGKAVLVEKPIATTLEDADAMIACAQRTGATLMIAEDMHFRPTVGEAVRRIVRGDVGEPLYLLAHGGGIMRPRGWKADPVRSGGGVLMDIGVHYVRALRLLMGEPTSVIASRAMQMDTHAGVEDSVQLMASSAAGWEAHMLLSWATTRGFAPDIVVVGNQGTLHLWAGMPHLDYYAIAPRPLTALLDYVRPAWLQRALRRPTQQRVRVILPGADGTGHAEAFREFLSAVEETRPLASPPDDARRDLEIVLSAYRALATGHRTAIP